MLNGIEGVSTASSSVNTAMYVVYGINIGVFILVIGVMFYFAYKYSSKRNPRNKIKNIEHNTPLEIVWTIIPLILVMIMFYYGFSSLKALRTIPKDNMEIQVTGQMWSWKHKYPNGKITKDLYVPVGKNIKLDLTAPKNDVIHSYYIPAFRFKQDVVPGYTYNAWFNATKKGAYDIECAEYCGRGHSTMLAKVYVLSQEDFDAWYNSDKKTPFSKKVTSKLTEHPGLTLIKNNGCTSCHDLGKNVLVGPGFKGIFGTKIKVTENGTLKEVVIDEAYIKESILEPNKQIVEGFNGGMMSSFKGVLNDEQINQIIDYLKGGKIVQPKVDKKVIAKEILENNGCLGCHSTDGSARVGPSYKGIFERKTKVKIGDTLKEIVADKAYIKESILNPNAKIVDGFNGGMMSSYKGVLSNEDIDILIEYFKGL